MFALPSPICLTLAVSLACCCLPCAAAAQPEAAPVAVWLSPGLWSHHFDRSAGYRESNWGPGVQVDLSPGTGVVAGNFINSDRARSRYAGVLWQPLDLGYARLGVYGLAMDGYPLMRKGGWFPALIPVASLRYGPVGINLTVVPNYGKRLHGAVAAQFLFRVW